MLTVDELAGIELFAGLGHAALERLAHTSADLRLQRGEYAVHEGEIRALYIVLEGACEVTKTIDGIERTIGARGPSALFGEVPVVLGTPFPASLRASEPSRVMRVEAREYHAIAALAPELSAKVGASARERMEGLQDLVAEADEPQVTILGPRYDPNCHELRRFLDRNAIPFDWLEPDEAEVNERWPQWRSLGSDYPMLRFNDNGGAASDVLVHPSFRAVAERAGLQTCPTAATYDTVIIGGGPAGLAAAVYGSSEGLRTVMIEREAPGGQAGTSSRIENYLGFPTGVSGDELSSRALQQARRLGAEILVTRTVERIDPHQRAIVLDEGDVLQTRTIVLATGVSWRRLTGEGFNRLVGKGVYYGAARSEAGTTQGLDIVLIGAGNSAGQAALFFSGYARTVTLVVRGDALAKSMSHYLVEQVNTKANIEVRLRSEVTAAYGDEHLEEIDLADRAAGTSERRRCGALFVFIGADAETAWLPLEIARDKRGYILTGADVIKHEQWTLERDPYLLETSVPGIFACGDVRCNSVKRVASGVGEGSMAIAFIHQYLAAT
jgi:thioredoxin reductase (NADPH)